MSSVAVPQDGESIQDYLRFATATYDGYDRHGGVNGLGALANPASAEWTATGGIPKTVDELRACLFFEARRWHHYGYEPDDDAETYVRALIAQLRTLSGGMVETDRP